MSLLSWIADRYWRWQYAREMRRDGAWERGPRAHGLFPAYADWGGGIAVDATGEVWYSESPTEWTDVRRVDEPDIRHAALAVGADRHAAIAHLRPVRSEGDPECPTCGGAGIPMQLPPKLRDRILCQCGGLGWVPVALTSSFRPSPDRREPPA